MILKKKTIKYCNEYYFLITLTSPHNWKYTMTIDICEHEITRIQKTRNRNPKR